MHGEVYALTLGSAASVATSRAMGDADLLIDTHIGNEVRMNIADRIDDIAERGGR
jgi:hypothetical protein